jgi:thymidylate synthase
MCSTDEIYLSLVKRILDEGDHVDNERTGVGTISLFGAQAIYDISDCKIPLLTTKQVFHRGVLAELIDLFLQGKTDSAVLEEQKVNIWKPNTSESFIQNRGLDYQPGDLGPMYGFQWRHWNAPYHGKDAEYAGKGIDQIQKAIDTIKNNPGSRRIIVSAYNPEQLQQGVLEPCHVGFQFSVRPGGFLDCHFVQRSADMALGVPFNIVSYAVLTHIIAKICGLKGRKLIHTISDAHVYMNHLDQIKEQMSRDPICCEPKIIIDDNVTSLEDVSMDSVRVDKDTYHYHPKIAFPFAV